MKIRTILALLLSLSAVATAQEPIHLTINRAIDLALQHNQTLEGGRLGIALARAQVDEARSAILPTVALGANYTRNLAPPVFFFPGGDGTVTPITVGLDNALSATLTLRQPLFNSSAFGAVKAAKTYTDISREQLRSSGSEVVFNVRQAYYAALLAREMLSVNQLLLANAQENLRNTRSLVRSGLRAEFDSIRAVVQVANQRPQVVQSNDAWQSALDNLRLAMGIADSVAITLDDTLTAPLGKTDLPTIERARGLLRDRNPQIKTLELTTEEKRQLIEVNRGERYPKLYLIGQFESQTQFDHGSQFDPQQSSFVGVNLSYDLFNGGGTGARIDEAQISLEQSVARKSQTELALTTHLAGVLRRIGYAAERIHSSESTIELAQRGYQIATSSYKAGTGTQLQINDADLALAQARVNRLSAIHDYDMAVAELDYLLGNGVSVDENGVLHIVAAE